jgi:hypothetical protein
VIFRKKQANISQAMMPRMAYRVIGVDCEATTIAFLSCAASERDLSDPLRWLVHVVEERCDRDSLDGWDDGMMRYRSQIETHGGNQNSKFEFKIPCLLCGVFLKIDSKPFSIITIRFQKKMNCFSLFSVESESSVLLPVAHFRND